jgi:uncharacterized protein (DUF302 family)
MPAPRTARSSPRLVKLRQAGQESGIDLPLKALVYQDAEGRVWLAYNDPHWLADRRHLPDLPNIATLARLLEKADRRGDRAVLRRLRSAD